MIDHIETFKALADETRLRLINLFVQSGKSLCVCEMVDALMVPQYQVSRHLATLRHASLLNVDKEGTWAHYGLNRERAENAKLFEFLKTFLQGEPFESDRKRLNMRLLLREKDKCVIGFVPEDDLKQLIKKKLGEIS